MNVDGSPGRNVTGRGICGQQVDPAQSVVGIDVNAGTFLVGVALRETDVDVAILVVTETSPVPEPASLTLLGLGLAGMGARRWRQRKAS